MGPVVCLLMSLSIAVWNVEDVVSFGRSSNEAATFVIFSLLIFLMHQNVLNRGLKQVTHRGSKHTG